MRATRFFLPILTLSLACHATLDDAYLALPAVGQPVPAFAFTALDGSMLSRASLHGAPAVIALWSTTCSASRLALASIGSLETAYAPRGVRVVILANDRDSAAVALLLARSNVHASVALGSRALMDTFTHGQSVLPWRKAFSLPSFLVLDSAGTVRYRQVGIEQDSATRLLTVRAHLDSLVAAAGAA